MNIKIRTTIRLTLAIQAYLDNYEFIEAPLAEQNKTLMETTELMLREDLRQLIQTHAPLEQIQEHIDKINSNLNQAEELLRLQVRIKTIFRWSPPSNYFFVWS